MKRIWLSIFNMRLLLNYLIIPLALLMLGIAFLYDGIVENIKRIWKKPPEIIDSDTLEEVILPPRIVNLVVSGTTENDVEFERVMMWLSENGKTFVPLLMEQCAHFFEYLDSKGMIKHEKHHINICPPCELYNMFQSLSLYEGGTQDAGNPSNSTISASRYETDS